MDIDEYLASEEAQSAELEVLESEDQEQEQEQSESDNSSESNESDTEELDDDDGSEPTKPEHKTEENAKAAQRRREAQERQDRLVQERVQAELERVRQQSPEFTLAKELADTYGVPVETMLENLREARLKQQAEKENVPVEVLREQQRLKQEIEALKMQSAQSQYQSWVQRVESEAAQVKTEFPMLSDDDMTEARRYMLTVVKNPEMKLEEAVFAIHGKKIAEGLKRGAEQEALAQMSGRSKSALPIQTGKSKDTVILNDDQRFIARQFRMSDEEYAKWMTK